jgi:hypothetical protein
LILNSSSYDDYSTKTLSNNDDDDDQEEEEGKLLLEALLVMSLEKYRYEVGPGGGGD